MSGRLHPVFILVTAAGCLFSEQPAATQVSDSYRLVRSVFSNGGDRALSDAYSLQGTIGQASPVQVSSGGEFCVASGFWGGAKRLFEIVIKTISYNVSEGVRITWESFSGAAYTIFYAHEMALPSVWKIVKTVWGTGEEMEWIDDGTETHGDPRDLSERMRFYRLLGEP